MIEATTGIRPEEIRQSGQHVLFVEGRGSESFDIMVLGELFEDKISIEPLGPSYSVKSVAEALHPFHQSYYFIIDRDHHHDDSYISNCWDNFPNPDTHNLLIWKQREIENYFLEPEYLVHSNFLGVSKKALEDKIRQFCQDRLYLDAANYVVVSIREELKKNWIHVFKNPADFNTRDNALAKLKSTGEYKAFRKDVSEKIDPDKIEQRFNEFLQKMTDGTDPLEYGNGRWLEMIQGKKVFSQVVNSNCFRVENAVGNLLHGQEKINQVVKNLLRKEVTIQPDDFRKLKVLIKDRIGP